VPPAVIWDPRAKTEGKNMSKCTGKYKRNIEVYKHTGNNGATADSRRPAAGGKTNVTVW
jgi:hypothetical protein